MAKNSLNPTANQAFRITHDQKAKGNDMNFAAELVRSQKAEEQGRFEEACEIRFAAVQALIALLPEDEVMELDWEDEPTRHAMELLYCSAVDHFLVSDWEMCAALLEQLLDLDGEDHLEATTLLAYAYLALGEAESYEDIAGDISDKSADGCLLALWHGFLTSGELPAKEAVRLKRNFTHLLVEFTAADHPTDKAYLDAISAERPTKQAQAREMWLRTEHLWATQPDFIAALKRL